MPFQNSSKIASACRTAEPTTSASRSMKLVSVAALKYSSPTLRPPTTAIRPSAIQALLCMRRFIATGRSSISLARPSTKLRVMSLV